MSLPPPISKHLKGLSLLTQRLNYSTLPTEARGKILISFLRETCDPSFFEVYGREQFPAISKAVPSPTVVQWVVDNRGHNDHFPNLRA